MGQWGNLENLAWFWVLLPAALLGMYQISWKRQTLHKLAQASMLPILLKGKIQAIWQKPLFLGLFLVLSCIALLNPQIPENSGKHPVTGVEWVALIDVSNSMQVQDVGTTRLELAQLLTKSILDTSLGSKMALVAFAGDAQAIMPLTSDVEAGKTLLESINPKSVTEQGTNLQMGIETALTVFSEGSTASKAIVLLTDGESFEGDVTPVLSKLKQQGVHLLPILIGTEAGSAVKDENGYPLLTADGSPVISYANKTAMQAMAETLGEPIIHLAGWDGKQQQVIQKFLALPQKPLYNQNLINYHSFSYYLLLLAFLILVAYLLGFNRRFYVRKSALTILVLIPFFVFSQKKLQQADDLAKQGKWAEAAIQYQKVLAANPAEWRARLHLANVEVKQQNWQNALLEYTAALKDVSNNEGKIAIHNNLGLLYVKQQNFTQAIQEFTQALTLNTQDLEVQKNLQKALLDYQPPQPSSPKSQKNSPPKNLSQKPLQQLMEEEKKLQRKLQSRPQQRSTGKNW